MFRHNLLYDGFLAVIIGAGLFGIIGAFLALPIAASLPAVIKYVREDIQNNADEPEPPKKQPRFYKSRKN